MCATLSCLCGFACATCTRTDDCLHIIWMCLTVISPIASSGLVSHRLQSMLQSQCVFSNSVSKTSRIVCLSSTIRVLELPSLISTLTISWDRQKVQLTTHFKSGIKCMVDKPADFTFLTLASFSFSSANLILFAFVWGSFCNYLYWYRGECAFFSCSRTCLFLWLLANFGLPCATPS